MTKEELIDEIMRINWGCGCCCEATKEELQEEVRELIQQFVESNYEN